jgi:hypothetical protein
MTAADVLDTNYKDGKIYTVDVTLNEEQAYTYTFAVENVEGQTASLGPLDGPVVYKKVDVDKPKPQEQALEDWLWILLIIIAAVICLAVGYLATRPKKPAMPPRPAEPYAETPPEDYPYDPEPEEPLPEEPTYEEPVAEEPPVEPAPEPEVAPEPAPEEAPPEEAPPAEEKPEPGPTEEQKAEEEKKAVDSEIDDILSKLVEDQ